MVHIYLRYYLLANKYCTVALLIQGFLLLLFHIDIIYILTLSTLFTYSAYFCFLVLPQTLPYGCLSSLGTR